MYFYVLRYKQNLQFVQFAELDQSALSPQPGLLMYCLSLVSTPPKWHVIDDRTSRHEAIVNCTAFWPRFNTSNSSELILTFKIGNSKLLEPRVHYYSNNILYNISNIK